MIYCTSGPEHFDDLKAYVEEHQLYEAALELFHESDKLPVRMVLLDQSPEFTNTP